MYWLSDPGSGGLAEVELAELGIAMCLKVNPLREREAPEAGTDCLSLFLCVLQA